MLEFALKILLAHLLSDFLLQPNKWVESRSAKHYKSKSLYLHALVHFAVLSLVLLPDFCTYFWGIIAITVSHFIVDLTKNYAEKHIKNHKAILFLSDQVLHLLVLALVVLAYFPCAIHFGFLSSPKLLAVLIAVLLATSVSMIIIKLFFAKWKLSDLKDESNEPETLANAGKTIGIIERLLIIILIVADMPEGIGFLLAAKSVFRFGDLTNAKDKKLTEYILLGTLMSFTSAIIIGLGLKYILKNF